MIYEKAYAKVNLALDVVRKRKDGFHDLKMIMIPLELHDSISFELDDQIKLESNVEIENNGIIKAARLLQDTYQIKQGAWIKLEKNIPIGAGLGGGSADIAATLRGLNQLWKLNLSMRDLEKLALQLGSDTVFCLHNKAAYVYGRGENLLFIAPPPISYFYIVYPDFEVSTKVVFENHKITYDPKRFNHLFTLYINEQMQKFFKKTYNVLTETTLKLYPDTAQLKRSLFGISKLARMSGSGSTFFIPVFNEHEQKFTKKINKLPYKVFKTTVKR